jgi:Putative amidoligase enzyme
VRNASDLLMDREGYLPNDFETFNNSGIPDYQNDQSDQDDDWNSYGGGDNGYEQDGQQYHTDNVLVRLATLFQGALGLPAGSISIEKSDYKKWQLTLDASLSRDPKLLSDSDHDLGVELISPVMTLRDGLVWMAKVFQMIDTFKQGRLDLYTTAMCGFHVNMSHVRMNPVTFDYAKLAIMSGDQHYLKDFGRLGNTYAVPLMRAVYDQLVVQKERPSGDDPRAQAALNLLRLRGWSPERVMNDLAALIPQSHHFTLDLSKLNSNNPYIEIRVAGNAQYEQRFDEIANLAIRFGALIKIACDPNAYREEYLRKVYQLVSGIVATPANPQQQNQQAAQNANPFPRLRIYLSPILSTAARHSLDILEGYWRQSTLSIPNGSYLILAIIRSAMDLRQQDTPRIKQGIASLLRMVLHIEPLDLLKALKNNLLLQKYGAVRQGENAPQVIATFTNYVKTLSQVQT